MCFAPERRALFRDLNFQKWSNPLVFLTFWLGNVLRATTACTFSTSQLPKVVRSWCVLYILTWKCASRHNGVHFFDISTSKVVRRWGVLYILTSKCGSRHNGVHFFDISTSKVLRPWCVLYTLTSKSASRHNGVHIFIYHLASWLRTRRFSEPTFRPSGATNHWKNTVFRDFPTFSRICIFFLLTLSLLIFSLLIFLFPLPLPCSAFHLSILSEVWLLNFLPYIYIYIIITCIYIDTIHDSYVYVSWISWIRMCQNQLIITLGGWASICIPAIWWSPLQTRLLTHSPNSVSTLRGSYGRW